MIGPGNIYVGTAGWHYRHWRGRFYPESLAEDEWLEFYSREFGTVELAQSFYELPPASAMRAWSGATPERFKFCVRAPRSITHAKKLKYCGAELSALDVRLEAFGDRLGPILFQLPPRWRCNIRRLAAFLDALPSTREYAFEMREPSWHADAVFDLLAQHAAAFCVFDAPGRRAPLRCTAPFACVRLARPAGHTGNYRSEALRNWVGRARTWNREGVDVYVLFDNDESAYAPRNARRFRSFMREGAREPEQVL